MSPNRITEMGFLRRLRGTDHQYEVRRILKAFVDANDVRPDKAPAWAPLCTSDSSTGIHSEVVEDLIRRLAYNDRLIAKAPHGRPSGGKGDVLDCGNQAVEIYAAFTMWPPIARIAATSFPG